MRYHWLLICSFFWIGLTTSYVEAATGAINDAEFIIEKQKKNEINPEKKIFFKAPLPVIKKSDRPLKAITSLELECPPFNPSTPPYDPFNLPQAAPTLALFHNYGRLGIASFSWLPYLKLFLSNLPLFSGLWSTHLFFTPELLQQTYREVGGAFKGKYRKNAWLLHTHLGYHANTHIYCDEVVATQKRIIHHVVGQLLVQQAKGAVGQNGKANYSVMVYHKEKISEQFCSFRYIWVKGFKNFFLKIATYNDIARYVHEELTTTGVICSAQPNLYLTLSKKDQLKVGLRMAYQNKPIEGIIPSFDLYPSLKIRRTITTALIPYCGISGMGIGGSVTPLHLGDIVAKNPFIAKGCKPSHTHRYLSLYLGSKGTFSKDASYHWHTSCSTFRNLSRIVPIAHQSEGYLYQLLYNQHSTTILKSTLRVAYTMAKLPLKITTKGTFYHSFENQDAPIWWYNKPRLKLKPTLSYSPHSKLFFNSSMDFRLGTTIKDINGMEKKLNHLLDVNLGADYCFNKRFMLFIIATNLFNRDNIPYTGYKKKKGNITIGIQYKW
ncbi:MAG: hypothetical protein K2X94_00635 [Amoebophilaceae bacterium]|nr:hypothetical protein [Amoebophilaceae bacterium]